MKLKDKVYDNCDHFQLSAIKTSSISSEVSFASLYESNQRPLFFCHTSWYSTITMQTSDSISCLVFPISSWLTPSFTKSTIRFAKDLILIEPKDKELGRNSHLYFKSK